MELNIDNEFALRLLLSFVIGTLIGLEREYRSKAAGLRTMIMICLGSTIFTEISISIGGNSSDRIASTIVTGIGFLGAGVIFKDGLTVSGLTTATAIWICAALGMAVGAGEYFVALVGSIVVMVVLIGLEKIQLFVERLHQERSYKITFTQNGAYTHLLEAEIKKLNLGLKKKRDVLENNQSVLHYEVHGPEEKLNLLNDYLKRNDQVKSYEY
jgi:putative Mg2+ transporter-C (MgtC) family protein